MKKTQLLPNVLLLTAIAVTRHQWRQWQTVPSNDRPQAFLAVCKLVLQHPVSRANNGTFASLSVLQLELRLAKDQQARFLLSPYRINHTRLRTADAWQHVAMPGLVCLVRRSMKRLRFQWSSTLYLLECFIAVLLHILVGPLNVCTNDASVIPLARLRRCAGPDCECGKL